MNFKGETMDFQTGLQDEIVESLLNKRQSLKVEILEVDELITMLFHSG